MSGFRLENDLPELNRAYCFNSNSDSRASFLVASTLLPMSLDFCNKAFKINSSCLTIEGNKRKGLNLV